MSIRVQSKADETSRLGQCGYAEAKRRYSMTAYLQERTTELAARLPGTFGSKSEWERYKAEFLPRLRSLLGFPEHAPMVSDVVDLRATNEAVRERVDYHFDGEHYVTCFVVRPIKTERERLPAVILNPGWPSHKWEPLYNHIAERWASEGFLTLIPDHAPFGEASDGPNSMINVMGTGMAIGMPYEGLRAYELIRAVDYLVTRPDVDPDRIGIIGMCQGSIDLWWAVTCDERFKVIGPTVGTTTHEAWAREYVNFSNLADASPYLPGILTICDTQHLYASWAPRPTLVQNNMNDNWWPLSGFDQVCDLAQHVYELYGCGERFEAHLDNQTHDITPLFESRLLNFFKRWLMSEPVEISALNGRVTPEV